MWALVQQCCELSKRMYVGGGFIVQPYEWLSSVFKLHSWWLPNCVGAVFVFFFKLKKKSCMYFGLNGASDWEVLRSACNSSFNSWTSLLRSFLLQFIPYDLYTSVPCLPTGLFWLLVLPVGKDFFQVRNSDLKLLVCPCCQHADSCMAYVFQKTFWKW